MGGTAWNRSVCTLIVPTMSRECGRAFHSRERSSLGRHLRAEERLEHLGMFHPRAMTVTTIQGRGSWVCQRRQPSRLFGENPGEKQGQKKFPERRGRCGGCGGWDANVRQPPFREYSRPRVAQSDQRCLLQRGKTLTMLIRQHFDKDRGALWRPCDVPGHALWYRQLVRKRSGVPR
jgi:hypothetical protein